MFSWRRWNIGGRRAIKWQQHTNKQQLDIKEKQVCESDNFLFSWLITREIGKHWEDELVREDDQRASRTVEAIGFYQTLLARATGHDTDVTEHVGWVDLPFFSSLLSCPLSCITLSVSDRADKQAQKQDESNSKDESAAVSTARAIDSADSVPHVLPPLCCWTQLLA